MSQIQYKFSTHGNKQLELSLTYPLNKGAKSECVGTDLYFFTPAQLGLNGKGHYKRNDFLENLQIYTRYNPPIIPLSKLSDINCDISPISRIYMMLKNSSQVRDLDNERILYELRTGVNSYHTQIKNHRKIIEETSKNIDNEIFIDLVDAFINEVEKYLIFFRKLYISFTDTRIPVKLREALRWSDEATSIKTERELYRLYKLLTSYNLHKLADKVKTKHSEEVEYKSKMGFATADLNGKSVEAENYLYRASILKKWAQSVMYLDNLTAEISNHLFHLFASAAAATAMAFAIFAAFLASAMFDGYSLPWVILIIISYIFKDRIKEVLRETLVLLIPRLAPQKSHKLIDPAVNNKVGSSKLNVYFTKLDKVPEIIRQFREIEKNPFRDFLPPENIIYLHTCIKIWSQKLLENHNRVNSITEIFRLNVSNWLKEMDNPVEELGILCEDDDIKKLAVKRVYHINVIIKINTDNTQIAIKRIIFNRRGILRIEDIKI